MLEEALTSPYYPPSETSLALLSFLRYELPAGGTAAEARFLRLFPLLVARIFGEVNSGDGYRYEIGGWFGRRDRWSVSPSGAGSSSSSGRSSVGSVGSGGGGGPGGGGSSVRSAGQQSSRRPGTPGGGGGGGPLPLGADPVVQLLSAGPRDDALYAGGGSRQQRQQPSLIDAASDESVHRPGVRFAFPFQALPTPTQVAFLALLLDGTAAGAASSGAFGGGSPSPFQQQQQRQHPQRQRQQQHVRHNASRLLGAALRVPASEQAELRYALQRQVQLTQQRLSAQRQQQRGGLSPGGGVAGSSSISSPGGGLGGLGGAGAAAAGGVLPIPTDVRATVMLSMLEYYLVHFVRFAAAGQSAFASAASTSTSGASSSSATPAANNAATQSASGQRGGGGSQRPQSSSSSGGVHRHSSSSSSARTSYGEQVYLHLFRSYARRYLPHSEPMPPLPSSSQRSRPMMGGGGGRRSASSSSSSTTAAAVPEAHRQASFLDLDRDSELFLRLAVEFWLDGGNWTSCAPTTADAVRCCLPTVGGGGPNRGPMAPSSPLPGAPPPDVDLDASSDLANVPWGSTTAVLVVPYGPPPPLVRRSVRSLVNHVVSDPAIGNAVAGGAAYAPQRSRVGDVLGTAAASGRGLVGGTAGGTSVPPAPTGGGPAASGGGSGCVRDWCLTPAMTIVQPSFYNYVRMNLRNAPVHVADSPFFSALNAWLVWLEPWNVALRKARPTASNFSSPTKAKNFLFDTVSSSVSGQARVEAYAASITVPKANLASRYTDAWEPYIAANLYLYAVPLAIFLRRARELDYSPRDFHRSLGHVQRVFRVFSPSVVDAIGRLLARQPGDPLSNLVVQHERVLGEFCPPTSRGGLSLSSCSQDMHGLLEEIYLQHRKKVRELDFFDRLASKLEGLAGQGTKGDEIALDRLLGQARKIVNLPADYEVLPGEKQGARGGIDGTGQTDPMKPERVHGGFLTETGRQQIVTGTRKCSALDVALLGDPMHSRVKSYEIPLLVNWTVSWSDWLNQRLGLVPMEGPDGPQVTPIDASDTSGLLLKLFREGEDSKRLWFRFNLRFLSDYRNLLVITSFLWIVWRKA